MLLLAARWLVDNGASHALAASALRQQMLPPGQLRVGGVLIPIPLRSRGSLTGSRVAGAMGRVPVESTIRDRHQEWARHGFQAGGHRLTVATYIDNIFSAGSSLTGAITLEDFAARLHSIWDFQIKPTSRSCLVPRGSMEAPCDIEKWPPSAGFFALGHTLQDSGSTQTRWQRTSRSMWNAYFGNCASKVASRMPVALRYTLVDKSELPTMQQRNTR